MQFVPEAWRVIHERNQMVDLILKTADVNCGQGTPYLFVLLPGSLIGSREVNLFIGLASRIEASALTLYA